MYFVAISKVHDLIWKQSARFWLPFSVSWIICIFLFFIRDLALFDRLNANMFEGTEQ